MDLRELLYHVHWLWQQCISLVFATPFPVVRNVASTVLNAFTWSIPLCTCAKWLQSCPTLCSPMDCSPPGSSIHWILQVRILEWVAFSSSRNLSDLCRDGMDVSCVSWIGRLILYHWAIREAHRWGTGSKRRCWATPNFREDAWKDPLPFLLQCSSWLAVHYDLSRIRCPFISFW